MTDTHPHRTARRALVAMTALLLIAVPASAQLSLLGSASGQAGSTSEVAGSLDGATGTVESAAYGVSQTHVSAYQEVDLQVGSPEVDIEGTLYQVISYADLLGQADTQIHACGSLSMAGSIEPPMQLASYSELCSYFDAQAIASSATGIVHSVQLPDSSWISAPDLHIQASADIEADGELVGEAAGEAQGQAEGVVGFVQQTAAKIEAGFKASVSFFGSLF